MAESFSHKLGQIIGNLIQEFIRETLEEVANEQSLYLDYQKKRKARPSKKVSWEDRYGNSHDLDYVLERGGTENTRGLPAAFIETAWRRYTKHSRNKAQEIEGALIPLADTYSHLRPFLGAILAGVFTPGSLNQLQSKGFEILYLQYDSIVQAFASVGIDASFDEKTPEVEFQNKIGQWNTLSPPEVAEIKNKLLSLEKVSIDSFINSLHQSFSRRIQGVTVTVLHGLPQQITNIEQAIEYIENYADTQPTPASALKYEVDIRYNNGDLIHAILQTKAETIRFLRTFA
ncbi:DNA methylase [Planktothrix sp. FACHB-1355]|uniref:DNA methylase n=1 Tax=Aerosakkonema funiforme FACHB-1375 TaxID=2949571 RepID=A0A926ZLV4_9CYAN|nr:MULTISPECIES: DNA methylase [Oscillatoriales]MBD2185451.1 DNA methylase [Aerosakkonema funiforme FACHB-1375]MBD3558153.1 DNA methylase [Planktothrix sp. FACHB-1355]